MKGDYVERSHSFGDLGVDVDLVDLEVFLGPSNVLVALDRSTCPKLWSTG